MGVWYSTDLFRGYPACKVSPNSILARNINQTGFYSLESDKNVVLSPELIKEKGQPSSLGNRMTSYLYAGILKIAGDPNLRSYLLLSIVINALAFVVFLRLILYLFDFKIASLFGFIYILLPLNWQVPYNIGTYEFAFLFFSLFLLFYFIGQNKRHSYLYYISSGLFLALAVLSREALLLIVPFLMIFLFIKKRKKQLLYIFIPFSVIFLFFWLPSLGQNINLNLLSNDLSTEDKIADFSFYGHLYPDPYTYHFEKEDHLENIVKDKNFSVKNIETLKYLKNIESEKIGFLNRIQISLMLVVRHLFRFISLQEIGGSLVLLLFFLGLLYLKNKNKFLMEFIIYWILSAIVLMAFVLLLGRSHMMDFNWALALLVALGVLFLSNLIANHFNFEHKKRLAVLVVMLIAASYHLVLSNHVVLGRVYDQSDIPLLYTYAQQIDREGISNKEVIALDIASSDMYNLNFLTDKSYVIFRAETIKRLLKEESLNRAFENYNVGYIIGYSENLSDQITQQVGVVNISSNSVKPFDFRVSRNKGWLMNLVK